MASKNKKFVDDGWAVWIEGEDISTVYLNDWINPKGNSYIDIAVKIKGINKSRTLNIFIPFDIEREEIQDLSHHLQNENIFRITFNSAGIIDYLKNEYTSEAAYNGKTLDIIHLPNENWKIVKISNKGTLISCDIEMLKPYINNDEAYFYIRLPHKSLNQIFKNKSDVTTMMARLRDLITSPVISENYVYQIRLNEARMLPLEINKIGSFHRQKLNKTVVSIAVNEEYEVNDYNCYRVRRIEEELYKDFVPNGFSLEDTINYLWQENIEENQLGRFNFYLHITRNKIGHASMIIYMILLTLIGFLGEAIWEFTKSIFHWFE